MFWIICSYEIDTNVEKIYIYWLHYVWALSSNCQWIMWKLFFSLLSFFGTCHCNCIRPDTHMFREEIFFFFAIFRQSARQHQLLSTHKRCLLYLDARCQLVHCRTIKIWHHSSRSTLLTEQMANPSGYSSHLSLLQYDYHQQLKLLINSTSNENMRYTSNRENGNNQFHWLLLL